VRVTTKMSWSGKPHRTVNETHPREKKQIEEHARLNQNQRFVSVRTLVDPRLASDFAISSPVHHLLVA